MTEADYCEVLDRARRIMLARIAEEDVDLEWELLQGLELV